jgi:uncharacterized membrane protein SpoIIM required for sporulation
MMFCFYIYNNVAIDFRIFAGGMAGGAWHLVFPAVQRPVSRRGGGLCEPRLQSGVVLVVCERAFVVELLGMVVSGMAGMRLGLAILRPGRLPRTGAGGGIETGAAADLWRRR